MQITVPITSALCIQCVIAAGIDAVIDMTQKPPVATIDNSELAAFQAWLTVPPPPHNHYVNVDPALSTAWDEWGEWNVKLKALDPAPLSGSDPWAALRTRWTANRDAAEAKARALGDPA